MNTIICSHFTSISETHSSVKDDFCVYLVDVLPIDEKIVPGITSYIGSAGANAQRVKETKHDTDVKGSFGRRYKSSYIPFHTRPESIDILRCNVNKPFPKESRKEFLNRCNQPGYKNEERKFLGIVEYQLHRAVLEFGLLLNNKETPKHVILEGYEDLVDCSFNEFFNFITFTGHIPPIIQIARNEISLEYYREQQRQYALKWARAIQEELQFRKGHNNSGVVTHLTEEVKEWDEDDWWDVEQRVEDLS